MGVLEFESWSVSIDDLQALNNESEIVRLGLVFERHTESYVSAWARGNVATYYVAIQQLVRHIQSGGFQCIVTYDSGDKKHLQVSATYALEGDKDISALVGIE